MGSYDYIVNEYELMILDEEIEKELRSISIREEDAPYIEMKQMAIGYNESRRGVSTNFLNERKANQEKLMKLHIGELDRNQRIVSLFKGDRQLRYHNDDALDKRDLPDDYVTLSTWIRDNEKGLSKYYKSHYYSEIEP